MCNNDTDHDQYNDGIHHESDREAIAVLNILTYE